MIMVFSTKYIYLDDKKKEFEINFVIITKLKFKELIMNGEYDISYKE
ncbi:hypothetical protein [uncultured Ilyobacter sp.]|nr:hypothetical protein [uncultured Ilyobacter sp.]